MLAAPKERQHCHRLYISSRNSHNNILLFQLTKLFYHISSTNGLSSSNIDIKDDNLCTINVHLDGTVEYPVVMASVDRSIVVGFIPALKDKAFALDFRNEFIYQPSQIQLQESSLTYEE